MGQLLDDASVAERVLQHIDNGTTDLSETSWLEPVENYRSWDRFQAELELLRRLPVPFCPSASLPDAGCYVARTAAGTPIVVVRDETGTVRGFRNACRHRGMQVAQGSGCARFFTCSYHGWTYRLDGGLHHIPHQEGFPGLDANDHSLVPVTVTERHGLVFVTQDEPVNSGALNGLDGIAPIIDTSQRVFAASESESDVNWKLNLESNLEGYHIRTTHPESFYPYGYDNLNVVETFGNNARVTFPFRRIEKLRDTPPGKRDVSGKLTYVYHLFPNVIIAVLSSHTAMSISEPVSPTQTRFVSYRLTNAASEDSVIDLERAKRDAEFVASGSAQEDAVAVSAIQQGLGSGANDHFTFGKFEKAIVHFHQCLTDSLQRL
jgi:phenylpropionate dioxygenase-like ring-hydroxylating dioxygenase large terminal subunit